MFNKSLKFWHARYGPSVPKMIVNQVLRFSAVSDFIKEHEKMYPEKLYVRSGMEYCEVESKSAFHFGAVRKLLVKEWEISGSGPSIDP